MANELGQKGNLLDTPELCAYYSNDRLLWRNLALIGLCNIGWSVATGITGPLMVLKLLEVGVTEGYQGVVGSVNSWLLSFLVMYFSWKSDHTVAKMGRRKPFLFLAAGPIILSTALFPVFHTPVPLVGLWLMMIMFGNMKASTFPLLNIDCVRRDMLARAQSILRVAYGLVMFGAMRLAPSLIDRAEWLPYVIGAALLTLSTVVAWWIKEPPISNPATHTFKPWSAIKIGIRDRRVIWLMVSIAMIASFESIYASWAWIWAKTTLGLDRNDIFEAMSWASLVSTAIAFPVGWAIDKFGGFRVAIVYYFLMLGNLIVVLNVHDAFTLTIFVVVMTIAAPLNDGVEIMLYKTADPKEVGSIISSLSFFRNLYGGTLLFCTGLLIEFTNRNYSVIFIMGSVLMSIGLAVLLIYRRKMSGDKMEVI